MGYFSVPLADIAVNYNLAPGRVVWQKVIAVGPGDRHFRSALPDSSWGTSS